MSILIKDILLKEITEPRPDIAICSVCGWRGPVSECSQAKDGDWETGYYYYDECPKCEDGGCVDDYDMTPQRAKEWEEWNKSNTNSKGGERMDDIFREDGRVSRTSLASLACRQEGGVKQVDVAQALDLLKEVFSILDKNCSDEEILDVVHR